MVVVGWLIKMYYCMGYYPPFSGISLLWLFRGIGIATCPAAFSFIRIYHIAMDIQL